METVRINYNHHMAYFHRAGPLRRFERVEIKGRRQSTAGSDVGMLDPKRIDIMGLAFRHESRRVSIYVAE